MTDRPCVPLHLETTRVVAILRKTDAALAVETVAALRAGGIRAVEVTCNSPGVFAMIDAIARAFGAEVALGAGTVLDLDEAQQALDAGAQFVVSPHTDERLVASLAGRGIPCIPGAFSPTEVLRAWRAGAAVVKLFPAGPLGPGAIRDLHGPLPEVPLLPTGGITLDNCGAFIRAGAWGIGVGSALVDPGLVGAQRFEEIERRAAAFAAAVGAEGAGR